MAQKVSVVIPNYNGRTILEKTLPNVIKNCAGCEIIVVDDGSSDKSVEYLSGLRKIKLIVQKKNKGFSATVNNGVKHSQGDLVLLLNSDVSPLPDFLKKLTEHFKNDEKLFAVAAADNSYEEEKIIVKGRGGASISKGFLLHYALTPEAGQTLWVSGGSGLFDRKKFLKLGGFDTNFAPFYWEDIDLSYRARKSGLYCLFEPDAKVNHFHEQGAIIKTKSQNYIKAISYKNQFIFFWKNISDPIYNCQHLFFLPYHFLIAAIKGDWAFYQGFFKAALQIPHLILNYEEQFPANFKSDRDILKAFEKN